MVYMRGGTLKAERQPVDSNTAYKNCLTKNKIYNKILVNISFLSCLIRREI